MVTDRFYTDLRNAAIVARMDGLLTVAQPTCKRCAGPLQDAAFKHCVPCRGMAALRRAEGRRKILPRSKTFQCRFCLRKEPMRRGDQQTCRRKECKSRYMKEYMATYRGTETAKH